MAYRDLRDFVRKLEKSGELKRISAEVDPVLEITEITDRAVKAGGPALLFERPKGSRIPAITNLVGSERRMNLALEVESLDEVAGRVQFVPRYAVAAGAAREGEDAAEARGDSARFFRRACAAAIARKWSRRKDSRCSIFRYCNAGRRTAGATSRGRW